MFVIYNNNNNNLFVSFTAPVSEQLPSIQPPPAHSASNPLLDQSHLMIQHQNHGYIGMANVFDSREVRFWQFSFSMNKHLKTVKIWTNCICRTVRTRQTNLTIMKIMKT